MSVCLEKVAELVQNYLQNIAVGLYTLLNRRSLAKYHMRLSELIVKHPLKAFKLLEEVYSRDSALIIMKNVLAVAVGDPLRAEEAVARLARGDEEYARRLFEEACKRFKPTPLQ